MLTFQNCLRTISRLVSATAASGFSSAPRFASVVNCRVNQCQRNRWLSTVNMSGNNSASATTSSKQKYQPDFVPIYFILRDGSKVRVDCRVGDNLLDIIIDQNVDIDGFGACGGTLSCSTCHLIFDKANYDSLPNKVTEEEQDMLDMAYELSDTSRLGCQIVVTPDMQDWVIKVPNDVADARIL